MPRPKSCITSCVGVVIAILVLILPGIRLVIVCPDNRHTILDELADNADTCRISCLILLPFSNIVTVKSPFPTHTSRLNTALLR